MYPRPGQTTQGLMLAVVAMGLGCGTAAPRAQAPVSTTTSDPEAIQSLPGYRGEMVDAPNFSGQVYVMEAGPADAEAVVLVHGLGESGSRDWHSILPALRIRDSQVAIEHTRVVSQAVALEVKGSRVVITASAFAVSVAIHVDNSDLDLAGVELQGQRASVHVGYPSRLIFSVSHLDSPIQRRTIHDLLEPNSGEDL